MAKTFQYGLGGYSKLSSTDIQSILDRISALSLETISVQVTDVNYSNGAITGKLLGIDANEIGENTIQASPLFSNIKNYPLKNETVICITSINYNYQNQPNSTSYYYISPVNIWFSQNTNPLPLPNQTQTQSTEGKSNDEVEAGSSNKSQNTPQPVFKPGTYFSENGNILPLYSFEGDIIVEGRFGNSIRLGSTNIVTEEVSTPKIESKSFSAQSTFNSGEYNIPQDFISKLNTLNQEVQKYTLDQSSVTLGVRIESGESLVPNPNNLSKGELALKRLSNLNSLLESTYPLLNNNIVANTTIGATPYTTGIDNPQDIKYINEQYIKIEVYVEKTIIVSTNKQVRSLNSWSNAPTNGDPITIIRNGQTFNSSSNFESTVENLDTDPSSIWLTSTQKLPITGSSIDYTSYAQNPTPPEALNQYSKRPQIVLNSGRLVFNTTQDHLMLSSKKTINLNSVEGVNVDTRGNFVIQSPKVYLGDSEDNLTQPVVLGDDLVSLLTDILTDLNTLTRSLQNQVGVPVGTPLAPTSLTAQLVADKIPSYKRRVGQLLSNTTRTAV